MLLLGAAACTEPKEAPKQEDLLTRKLEAQRLDPDKKALQQVDRDSEALQSGVESGVPEEVLERIRNDVAALAKVSPDSVRITSARVVDWPDGSLGCPAPDQVYTQMVVPGFHVLAAVGVRKFDYRVAGNEYKLCDSRLLHRPDIRQ